MTLLAYRATLTPFFCPFSSAPNSFSAWWYEINPPICGSGGFVEWYCRFPTLSTCNPTQVTFFRFLYRFSTDSGKSANDHFWWRSIERRSFRFSGVNGLVRKSGKLCNFLQCQSFSHLETSNKNLPAAGLGISGTSHEIAARRRGEKSYLVFGFREYLQKFLSGNRYAFNRYFIAGLEFIADKFEEIPKLLHHVGVILMIHCRLLFRGMSELCAGKASTTMNLA